MAFQRDAFQNDTFQVEGALGYYYRQLVRLNGESDVVIIHNETIAVRRRVFLFLVDATDGLTPETGEAGGQPQLSVNGSAWTNTTNTLVAVGNGTYYVELDASEVSQLGPLSVRYKSANTAEFSITHSVIETDLYGRPEVSVAELQSGPVNDISAELYHEYATLNFPVVMVVPTTGTKTYKLSVRVYDWFDEDIQAQGSVTISASNQSGTSLDSRLSSTTMSGAGFPDTVYSVNYTSTAGDTIEEVIFRVSVPLYISTSHYLHTATLISEGSSVDTAAIADAVWDEAMADHLTAGTTGEALNATPDLTVQEIVDGVWDEPAEDHDTDGTMGANLQIISDAVLVWPVPVGGGVTASTLIQRAMAISDMHDNFVSETEWLNWLNQEQYALRLFLARAGWQLPFDTTTATITSTGWSLSTNGGSDTDVATDSGHYVFTPTLADVMALVCVHQRLNGRLKLLHMNNAVDFLRQPIGGTNSTGNALEYRCRMYGNEIHMDFYPTPVTGETYLITYLSAPVPLTATDQAVALPMGWEERLVLGMARRALIKEESDPSQIERLIRDMDSQIEQLCWNRVTSESPRVRNTDPNVGTFSQADLARWQDWWWR